MIDLLLTFLWFSALVAIVYSLLSNRDWLRKKIPYEDWKWPRRYSRVLTVIFLAWVVYGLPQIRELLLDHGPEAPFELLRRINSDGWSGLWAYISRLENFTTIVVTITLAVSPILRPHRRYSWDDIPDYLAMLIPNLLVACLFPAVIGYHAAFATSPDLNIFFGLWAGIAVYLQWVIAYSLVALVLWGGYWHTEKQVASPPKSDISNTPKANIIKGLEPFISYLYIVLLVVILVIIGASSLAAFAVALFPISVGLKLTTDIGLGHFASSTLAVTNLFIAATIGFLKIDEFLVARTRCSLVGAFVVIALASAFFDLNDSHRIRELPAAAERPNRPNSDLVESFRKWQSARSFDETSSPYPIYIVAAQGGGIYAAYHSAQFMAAAQDMSPEFSNHVFAISGVSGGALGAATFSGLVAEADGIDIAPDAAWFQEQTDAILGQDLLTATVWTTLFTDPWSRIMPCIKSVCPGRNLSRAITFEHTLERAWKTVFPQRGDEENLFAADVDDQWSPGSGRPALLLNTTEVETGENVVISTAGRLDDGSGSSIRWLSTRAPDLDISLSTAVGLSARFPGLAPAGWYAIPANDGSDRTIKRRLVDGGYYDNSGVSAAIAVISALKPHAGNGQFVLISLNNVTESALSQVSAGGLSEIMSPLKTLASTRSARGKLAIEQAFVALDGKACLGPLVSSDASCVFDGAMRTTTLATPHPVPLGWQLSEVSRDAIKESIGHADKCADHDAANQPLPESNEWLTTVESFTYHNSCVLAQIRDELAK